MMYVPDDGTARRGIALFAALALMMIIALLVVGGAAASTLAHRASRLSQSDALLTAAGDYAANTLLADPVAYGLADLPLGQTHIVVIGDSAAGSATSARVAVTRLRNGVLWLVAEASIQGVDQGHRRINVVAHFPFLGPPPSAVVTSRGGVRVGNGVVFLSDSSHDDAECAVSASADVIVTPGSTNFGTDSVRVTAQGGAADSTTYFLSRGQLAALDETGLAVHVRGDTTIAGGVMDGVLIVDGNLTIAGAFAANGLLVVRGQIDAHVGGFSLTGAMMSFAPPSDSAPTVNLAGATLRYSRCAVDRGLRHTLLPQPVRQRSWAELF
jgi:hypothetical protein